MASEPRGKANRGILAPLQLFIDGPVVLAIGDAQLCLEPVCVFLPGYLRERSWDEQQLTPAQRAKARAEPEGLARITASLKRLAVWARSRVLPKSTLGKACDYLLSQWAPLIAHLHHGESRLDNNLVENAIRPSCIGKKNWLFIGHPDAGQRSAILYSLIVSCQRHGKDPMAYMKDLLTRLPRMTNRDDLRALTPRRWQPATS